MEEVWKAIPDLLYYEVSNLGNIRSFKGRKNTKLLTPRDIKVAIRGIRYKRRYFHTSNKKYSDKEINFKISRLVWEVFVGPIPDKYIIDHIDRNSLNDSLDNLRLATLSQNVFNSKRYSSHKNIHRGICYRKSRNKWEASLNVDKKKRYLGLFKSFEEAKKVYEENLIKYVGDFTGGLQ